MARMPAGSLTDDMKKNATRTAFLICVSRPGETETKSGSNKYYSMYLTGGELWVEYGRVDATCTIEKYGAHEWDTRYNGKVNKRGQKSYVDITHLKAEVQTNGAKGGFTPISNAQVQAMLDKLMAAAKKTVAANYRVLADTVTQKMIDEAQGHIDWIARNLGKVSLTELNDRLIDLFTVLPRQIASVQNELFTDASNSRANQDKLGNEQSLLDSMRGAVSQVVTGTNSQGTILDALGITMEPATDAELEALKKLAKDATGTVHWTSDRYKIIRAFKVTNPKTEAAMKAYVSGRPDKKTRLQFHGSRDENWLTILETGLLIRPAGVHTTGAMYGYGIYFSSQARKSIGYCSLRGTYWARGSNTTGMLAVYEVHTGKTYTDQYGDSSHTYQRLQQKGGYDSVLAPAGSAVYNDERIVYRPDQCTIRYLVEVTHA